MINHSLMSLALLVATALVAGYFAYIYNIKRQTYLLFWTAAWSLLALNYLGSALSGPSEPTPAAPHPAPRPSASGGPDRGKDFCP